MMISPWHHEKRVRITNKQAVALFLERGGRCHKCQRKLNTGDDWIVEHTLALENGGTNDWDNLDITCAWCKPVKDAEDHGRAAKSRDVAVRHFLPKSMRQSKWPKRTFRDKT